MARPIDGLHQAATDRAARMAQLAEQRHLQAEMIAAAHERYEKRRSEQVHDPDRSQDAKLGRPPEREGRRQGHERGGPGPGGEAEAWEDDGPAGGLLDVSV